MGNLLQGLFAPKPDTAKPDTTQTPAQPADNPTDSPNRNLAVTQTNNASDKRIALVIGNSSYTNSPLKNLVNDAKDMAKKLRGLGFDVIERSNLQTKQIGGTLSEFRSKLAFGAVALVFYAGHGLQINGENYLPAVDADINTEEDVQNQSLSVRQIMDVLDKAKTRLNLVFLDACRNNPYASRSFRSTERGLARVSAPSGTLISYATKPGSVAADGDGRNGLYTGKLLAQMDSNIQVEQTLKRVVTEVKAASQGKQEPWMEGSIEGDFCFGGCAAGTGTQVASLVPVPAREKTKGEIEDDYWDDIKDSNDLTSYEQYGKAYPEGRYLNPSNHKIAQLRKKIQDAMPVKPAEPAPAPTPAARIKKSDEEIEDDAWNAVETANTVEAANAYLAGYPRGRYVTQARIKLASLKPTPTKPAEVIAPPIRGDNESALWSEAQKGNSKDDYDAYLAQYPKGKYVALAKSRIKKLQDEAANEANRKEQDAWEAAGKSESEDGYQSYLNGWPGGKYAGLAQVRLRKLQTDLAAAQKKKHEEEAIQQAKQEHEAAARQEAERQRQQAEAAEAAARQRKREEEAAQQEAERKRKQAETPKGYVFQGGLTWMPVTFYKKWAEANSYCANTAINGQSGWRLPTKDELVALYNSGAAKGQGWALSGTWSSTPAGSGNHYGVTLDSGVVYSNNDTTFSYVTCVR